MKHLFTLLIVVICATSLWAQSPNKISYQAIVRDADGLVLDTDVSMQISILQGSATGTVKYIETHTASTNANGLLTIMIGTGTSSFDFSEIDWSDGPYFIKTETDPTGGSDFSLTGTSQLMSVPYALHAAVADSIAGGGSGGGNQTISREGLTVTLTDGGSYTDSVNTQNLTEVLAENNAANAQIKELLDPTDAQDAATKAYVDALESKLEALENRLEALEPPAVGDFRDGGVVFYILQPADDGYIPGEHHGLICAISDINGGASWGCSGTGVGAVETAIGKGLVNTNTITAGCTDTDNAAKLCENSTSKGKSDWYLPSKDELNKIYENKSKIDATAVLNGGAVISTAGSYWSSTEFDASNAYVQSMYNGTQASSSKALPNLVRAIRSF